MRLADNPTLQAALENHYDIVPLFILDQKLLQFSPNRNSYLFACLTALDNDLHARGSCLILRTGAPIEVFSQLQTETSFSKIFSQTDFSPYALKRDREVSQLFEHTRIPGVTIYSPQSVMKSDGNPYHKFTPYRNAWMALPREKRAFSIPEVFPACPDIRSESIPASNFSSSFPTKEFSASQKLYYFLKENIYHYSLIRNRMDLDKTSHLSPLLKFGLLSVQTVMQKALEAKEHAQNSLETANCQTWIDELIWRDFYYQIMFHHPQVLRESFNPTFRAIPWNESERDINSWQTGLTGYPIVDAGMRQLNQTGWMHNRARMITASFLVKDLLINWQEGEKYFKRLLIDFDPASNNGGWQWVAGTGTDSVPYFRVFNPIFQSKKFDPYGEYIRYFVPELEKVPNEFIHSPWLMPIDIQDISNCRIGKQYPYPIVNHAEAKNRTLEVYRKYKNYVLCLCAILFYFKR